MIHAPGWGRNKPRYLCPAPPRGCNGVSVSQEPVDDYVGTLVVASFDTAITLTNVEVVDGPAPDELGPLRERLTMFETMMAAGEMSAASYGRMVPKLEAEIAAVEERNADRIRARPTLPRPSDIPTDLREWWPTFTTAKQRELIELVVERIDVAKSTKTRVFDPERLQVIRLS